MDKATAYALGEHLRSLGFTWTLVRDNRTKEWGFAFISRKGEAPAYTE